MCSIFHSNPNFGDVTSAFGDVTSTFGDVTFAFGDVIEGMCTYH